LEPAPEARLEEILRAEGLPPSDNRISVAIRYWDQGVDPLAWENTVAAALAQIQSRHQAQIVLVPFQHFPGQQEDDVAVAQRVAAQIGGKDTFVLSGVYTPAEIAAVLGSSKLVLGMRLHAVIFALRAGRPFVALTYDRKVEEAVRRAGKPHLGIRMEDLSTDRLVERMDLAMSEPPADVRTLQSLASATMQHLRASYPGAAKPLSGPIVELVRNAIWSLLRSNAELRGWLREQKINYEYQVQVEQRRATQIEERCQLLEAQRDALQAERDRLAAERDLLAVERDELRRNLATVSDQLGVERARSSALDRELQKLDGRTADLERRHRETVLQWEGYFDELNRRLAEYRSQKPWLAMLALRKGYIIFARQGLFAALRWTLSLMAGKGRIETEQLEFPPRPRPRD
ncbi:MAG: polysaccharide pyruvyl transferase family protein, partial [Bryobacterales bacterium]|nr:polysaccharide pyruvyl transferase family protein [Bryobacterales bacterium]